MKGMKYLDGVLSGLAAVMIWSGWSVMTRLAVTTRLDAGDIAACRFGVAGIMLAPIVARRGLAINALGWRGLALLIAGQGAPYVLVAATGLRFAPVYDQGALNPGCMPLFVAFIAAMVLREGLVMRQKLGLGLISAGAVIIVAWHRGTWSVWRLFGDALFLCGACLTACFTVLMRRSRLDPLHAAALVSTGSMVIYLPFYLVLSIDRLARIPLPELAAQLIFQGVFVTIVGVVLYGRAVNVLGASRGAAFGALVPVLSGMFAIPLLGEWPDAAGWIGIILISPGVYLASGGPLPQVSSCNEHGLDGVSRPAP